jgi:ribosomal protein S17
MAKEQKAKGKSPEVGGKSLVGTSLLPISSRGRNFEGFVVKKFPKRIVLEFERTVYVQKYERFYKKKTRLHARLPDSMADEINVGDYIQIRECRPLSKIIHFMVIGKVAREAKK